MFCSAKLSAISPRWIRSNAAAEHRPGTPRIDVRELLSRYSPQEKTDFQYFQSSDAAYAIARDIKTASTKMTVKRERFYAKEIDVVVLFNLIHFPVHLHDSHDTPFAPRGGQGNRVGGKKGEEKKKDQPPLQIQEALPILVGEERALAPLKFMPADVPTVYACMLILCGRSEGSVVSASKKFARDRVGKKKKKERRAAR